MYWETRKIFWLALLWYLLCCHGLGLILPYPWGLPVLCSFPGWDGAQRSREDTSNKRLKSGVRAPVSIISEAGWLLATPENGDPPSPASSLSWKLNCTNSSLMGRRKWSLSFSHLPPCKKSIFSPGEKRQFCHHLVWFQSHHIAGMKR